MYNSDVVIILELKNSSARKTRAFTCSNIRNEFFVASHFKTCR